MEIPAECNVHYPTAAGFVVAGLDGGGLALLM